MVDGSYDCGGCDGSIGAMIAGRAQGEQTFAFVIGSGEKSLVRFTRVHLASGCLHQLQMVSAKSNFFKHDECFANGSGFGDDIVTSHGKEMAVVNIGPDCFNGISIRAPDAIKI